jgi:hypothetical protein
MVVGNDLWIWLKAVRELKTLYYTGEEWNGFGCHEGSVSFRDHLERVSGRSGKLLDIYNRVRKTFLEQSFSASSK